MELSSRRKAQHERRSASRPSGLWLFFIKKTRFGSGEGQKKREKTERAREREEGGEGWRREMEPRNKKYKGLETL